jgi:fructuronate reductase
MVFDQLLASGDTRWGIHGVGMTRPDLVNQLKAQDGLYAVRVADGLGVKWQVPGALWRTSVATTERDAVVQAIAAPSTRWVTLTVTEKGYTPALGQLLLDGLRLRQQAGLPGITIASCDNLQGNGHKLQALVKAAARHKTQRCCVGSTRTVPFRAAWSTASCPPPHLKCWPPPARRWAARRRLRSAPKAFGNG